MEEDGAEANKARRWGRDVADTNSSSLVSFLPAACRCAPFFFSRAPLFSLVVHSLKDDNERRRTGPNFVPPTKLLSKSPPPPPSFLQTLPLLPHQPTPLYSQPTRPTSSTTSEEEREDINDFAVDLTRVAIQRRNPGPPSPPLLILDSTNWFDPNASVLA
jgi:hypothetical protein